MKAVIITYHKVYNYGSSLQAYATKKTLEHFFSEVEIINFIPERYKNYGSFKQTFKEKMYYTNNPIRGLLMTLKSIQIRRKQKKVFALFDNYLELGEEYDAEKLKKVPIKADAYFTGSDQVWNNFFGGFEKSFFLDFTSSEAKCFAYSASFGKPFFTAIEQDEIKKLLNKYSLISVRENAGKKILNELKIPSVQLLDPVYFLKMDDWRKIKEGKFGIRKYILIYQLDSHGKLIEEARKLLKKYENYKIIFIETERKKRYKDIEYVSVPTVTEFLGLFWEAEYVITDSFHGTTFSICMNKDFSCILPKKYSNRIESVLSVFHLEDRVINESRSIELISEKKINWEQVHDIGNLERKKVTDFLNNCIRIVKGI